MLRVMLTVVNGSQDEEEEGVRGKSPAKINFVHFALEEPLFEDHCQGT